MTALAGDVGAGRLSRALASGDVRAVPAQRRGTQCVRRIRKIALQQLRELGIARIGRKLLRDEPLAFGLIVAIARLPRIVVLPLPHDARGDVGAELRTQRIGCRATRVEPCNCRDRLALPRELLVRVAHVRRQRLVERRKAFTFLRIAQCRIARNPDPVEVVMLLPERVGEERCAPIAEPAARECRPSFELARDRIRIDTRAGLHGARLRIERGETRAIAVKLQ